MLMKYFWFSFEKKICNFVFYLLLVSRFTHTLHPKTNFQCTHKTKLIFNTQNQIALLRKLDIFLRESQFKSFFRFVELEHFFQVIFLRSEFRISKRDFDATENDTVSWTSTMNFNDWIQLNLFPYSIYLSLVSR